MDSPSILPALIRLVEEAYAAEAYAEPSIVYAAIALAHVGLMERERYALIAARGLLAWDSAERAAYEAATDIPYAARQALLAPPEDWPPARPAEEVDDVA